MMSNNKILTVSYGTFSCTLEGFDDSFGTMKAIAEYFRGLAADDRYFGAEPPQPDAEMLARIAEREISRRVEAREQEGRIVLSAETPAPAPSAASPAALAAASAAAPAVAKAAAPDVADDVADVADEVSAPVADAAPAEVEAEVIEETPAAETDDAKSEIETETSGDAANASIEAESTSETDTHIDAEAEAEAEAEEFFAASTDDATEEDAAPVAEPVDTAPVADAAPDSIAAKLQRIRAVVSQSQEEVEEEELFEDEHAESFAPAADMDDVADAVETDQAPSAVLEAAADDIEAAQSQDLSPAEDEDEDDDAIADILARFEQGTDAAASAEAPAAVDVPASNDDDDFGLDTLAALMAADDGAPAAEEDKKDNIFDDAGDQPDAVEAAEQTDAPDATVDDAPAKPVARVIKVKRADIDAAIASGALEEVEDTSADSTLSDEDEAELLAELAEVEAELPKTDEVEADAAEDAIDAALDDPSDATTAPEEIKDDDVQRLMAEADNQMEEPEGSRRRNAFQHLKAAVMAKKADADIGKADEEDEGAFRSDLAEVVKPRRPAARGERAQRPNTDRPAPLKLVAEQRVDVDAAPKGPVTPRRVAAMEDAVAAEDAANFADYAADMGAHDLPALLEAAASYLSFVEGRDQFSRPQLMTKVRQVEQGDFSREDGLRSFGQLLRAGKIEKIKGGRFAVTGDIGYRPDQREAG